MPRVYRSLAVPSANGLSRKCSCRAALLFAACVVAFVFWTPPARAAGCDKVAATSGSDSAPGTLAQPFKNVAKLANSLSAGQTGCLRAGTYSGDPDITQGGNPGSPTVLTSYPGEQAEVVGRLWIEQGANNITLTGLKLNGKNAAHLPSPTVNANNVSFIDNDITNDQSPTTICMAVGNAAWGASANLLIQANKIHDCGIRPSDNMTHAIYLSTTSGAKIIDNWIYDNADRGIQLRIDADGTYIAHNVIDSNGEGILFTGDTGTASDNTVVEHNLITNSKLRHDVESWYPTGNPIGHNNVVRDNCIFGGVQGAIQSPQLGFSATSNLIADPGYVNRAAKDFRLQSASPCAGLFGGGHAPSISDPGKRKKPSRGRRRVKLRGARLHGSSRFRLTGTVASADVGLARAAIIRVRRASHWHTATKARVRSDGSFVAKLRFSHAARIARRPQARSVKVQALVRPGGGRSAAIRLRLR